MSRLVGEGESVGVYRLPTQDELIAIEEKKEAVWEVEERDRGQVVWDNWEEEEIPATSGIWMNQGAWDEYVNEDSQSI